MADETVANASEKRMTDQEMLKLEQDVMGLMRALAGVGTGTRARVSKDRPESTGSGFSILVPPDIERKWRDEDLDVGILTKYSSKQVLELLTEISPDISRAIWDFLRMMNPGWDVKVYVLGPDAVSLGDDEVGEVSGTKTDIIDPVGQQAINIFLEHLKRTHGSLDVIIDRINIGAFMRGAFFAELVLDRAGRVPIDIATPDPETVQFQERVDPERGEVWEPFQQQGSDKVSLDVPTVKYIPIDPLPGQPYGRGIAPPAMFATLFSLGLLHDLRRVVSQQGYPRMDITVSLEEVLKQIPDSLKIDPEKVKKYVAEVVRDIQNEYNSLAPDDAFVHTSIVQMNRPQGTVDSSSLGAIDGLIRALDRYAVRALKTVPLLFGIDESISESHANRQWEVMAAAYRSLQHRCQSLLEHLCKMALEAQGIQARVEWKFKELRAAELLRDAKVEALNIKNAALAYLWGWISHEEAALRAIGIDKPDQAEPRVLGAGIAGASAPSGAEGSELGGGDADGIENDGEELEETAGDGSGEGGEPATESEDEDGKAITREMFTRFMQEGKKTLLNPNGR